MRKIKLWKIIISSFMIIGGTALSTTIVSCAKKQTPSPKATWNQFQNKVDEEMLSNIVDHANPQAAFWYNLPDKDLGKDGNISIYELTLTIKIQSKSLNEEASFSITAPTNFVYNVKGWSCSKQPKPIPPPFDQWAIFKKAAQKVTAKTLLNQAKTSGAFKKFKWTGSVTTQTWQDDETAEFDIYGGSGNSDDHYEGMAGRPVALVSNQTITAIISIADSNKRGNYNSDPIKAVITDQGLDYNLNNWVFSQTKQLQSQTKYLSAFGKAIWKFPNSTNIKTDSVVWGNFGDNNYVYDQTDIKSVINYLNAHKVSNDDIVQINLDHYKPLIDDNKKRLKTTLDIHLWKHIMNPVHDYMLTLTNYFVFQDISNQNVGTAFNYHWTAKLVELSKKTITHTNKINYHNNNF